MNCFDATKTKRTTLYANEIQRDAAITNKCADRDLLHDTALRYKHLLQTNSMDTWPPPAILLLSV